ncbi:MAG: molybdopterin-dependent oxidoreductase [Halieaceae bacterium]|nr:molybdopterin-dependent oxidoreductase [Halieaceae bacterium]
MTETGSSTKRTHCKICTAQCGLLVEVENNRITRVKGDPEHPLSKGYTCPKGRALGRLHHQPDALSQPLIRQGEKLVVTDWNNCLDDIAARLRAIIDGHGTNSVAFFFGSGLGMDAAGYRTAEAFHQSLGAPPRFSPMTIDGANKVLVSSLMGGFPGLNGKTDNEHVDMLVYVGVNPVVSHGHNTGMFNPARTIRNIAERGQVWTIDPLRTETAKFSTEHIAPYPGKDYIILAWLVSEILADGPVEPAQPVTGMEVLSAALSDLDAATAAAIAGVPEAQLHTLLAAIRQSSGVVVETGTGASMSVSANLTQWFAWVLMILTGTMNQKGGCWFHPGFITRFDSFELPLLDNPFTPGAPSMPQVSGLVGEWPCAALAGEIDAGNIRALINLGGSMLRSFPDANRLKPALEKLALNVTFEVVANETTAVSSHVLPTKDQTERPEISFWDTLCGSVSLFYNEALLEPLGERRSAWWAISQLMQRLNLATPEHVPEQDDHAADNAMLAAQMQGARCSFDELTKAGLVNRPLQLPGDWVNRHIERIGGWRLAPQPLLQQWQEIFLADQAELGAARPLCFIPRRQRRKLNASLSFLGSPADIVLHPQDALEHGIMHGQSISVETESGRIELKANVSDEVRRGVASIPHGHETANVNLLTSAEQVDRLTGMVRYTGIPFSICNAS